MVDTLKSRTITNMDANPIVYDTAGFNILAEESDATDYCTATAAGLGSTSSTYDTVRLRSNVKLRSVSLFTSAVLDSAGSPLLTFDIGASYSDSTTDGTQPQLQGTSISANAIGAVIATPTAAGVKGKVEVFKGNPADMDKMLWDFLGLSSDPGGYIDLVVSVHAAAGTAVAGDIGLLVKAVAP